MIHKFKMFDTRLVVDVYSGAVHVFDEVAFEVLDFYQDNSIEQICEKFSGRFTQDEVQEAYKEIESLCEEGLLFSDDSYKSVLDKMISEPVIKAACFHISHDCNLRCGYCFASTGNFGGERVNMSFEVAKQGIDFLVKNSGKRKNIEVDFFGGEPLLNFEVVKQTVDYARTIESQYNKNFRFTITTNALLLDDEKIDYINKNMVNVVLSIDGRQEVNDLMRKRVDGTGSYNSILSKIKKLVDARGHSNYFVRGTFTAKNLDFSKDVLHLADLGFEQVSVEPVVACDGSGYEISGEHLEKLFAEYEELAREYLKRNKEGKGFNFFHFMLDLNQGPCAIKRLRGCGSGHEYISVTPEGDIYPCHQFVGIQEFKMGNVISGELNKDIQSEFKKSNVYTRAKCNDCWCKFYCSGGCAANAYQFEGNINSSYEIGCELEKKRVECALWLKANE